MRGVCHIIGTDCCTYVPDISDNMTHVVSHLNELLHEEKSKDSQGGGGGWDIWSWLMEGGWKAAMLKLLTPVLTVAVIMCCVLPCFKLMFTSLIRTTVGQYSCVTVALHTPRGAPPFAEESREWIPPYSEVDDLSTTA